MRLTKLTSLLGVCAFGIAVWTGPALFGNNADQRPDDRRDDRHDDRRVIADVWHVEEGVDGRAQWIGTWTRRGRSDVFEGEWHNVDSRAEARDRIRLIDIHDDQVVFHRDGTNGEYRGRISRDGDHMEGTATWYSPGGFWRADAVRR